MAAVKVTTEMPAVGDEVQVRFHAAPKWRRATVVGPSENGPGIMKVAQQHGMYSTLLLPNEEGRIWRRFDSTLETSRSPAPGGAHGQILRVPGCGCNIVGAGTLPDPLRIEFCQKHAGVL